MQLRKIIKIKTFAIFLAWVVIFTHNIIPHNHVPDSFEGCHELVHDVKACTSNIDIDSDTHYQYISQPEEIKLCHFSNILFGQLGQDNVLFSTTREYNIIPAIIIGSVLVSKSELFLFRPFYGSSSLRAPPVA